MKSQKLCLSCGSMVLNKYCSPVCQQNFQYKLFVERWLQGDEDGVVSGGLLVSNYIRRWIIENRGEKCESCGWCEVNPTTNKIPLQLDHIDGNALNNRPDNLKLICPNCHSLTPTFGALNAGNGRQVRYKKKLSVEI